MWETFKERIVWSLMRMNSQHSRCTHITWGPFCRNVFRSPRRLAEKFPDLRPNSPRFTRFFRAQRINPKPCHVSATSAQ